jgi:hypothetical protein
MSEVYAILDLNSYVVQMRDAAAKSLAEDCRCDNLDDYISIDQMINLVKSKSLGTDDNSRLLLNEDGNEQIFEAAAIWIHNVGLAKLAALDLIECAWDDEFNEMIFWAKKKTKNKREKKSNGRTKSRRKDMGDQK